MFDLDYINKYLSLYRVNTTPKSVSFHYHYQKHHFVDEELNLPLSYECDERDEYLKSVFNYFQVKFYYAPVFKTNNSIVLV